MVTGEVPFDSDTFVGTLTKHRFEEPIAPRSLRPDLQIPGGLEGLILRALAKKPEDRFPSVPVFAHALAACVSPNAKKDEAVLDSLTPPPPPCHQRAPEVDLLPSVHVASQQRHRHI